MKETKPTMVLSWTTAGPREDENPQALPRLTALIQQGGRLTELDGDGSLSKPYRAIFEFPLDEPTTPADPS